MAKTGAALGLQTEQRILQDLSEHSECLKILLSDFAHWLWQDSVRAWCFFELRQTDYGKRYNWKWKDKVVDEQSACIDSARKEGLPTDHFSINKFVGATDPCYIAVMSRIRTLADEACTVAQLRRYPRIYRHDDSDIPKDDRELIRSLFKGLSQPVDVMARLQDSKGEKTQHTCEWIHKAEAYKEWHQSEGQALLHITGPPGAGKTMLSMHLIELLIRNLRTDPTEPLFAFFFCEHAKQFTAADICRSLIVQVIQQQPAMIRHAQPRFRTQGSTLGTDTDALWHIILEIFADPAFKSLTLLLDALDECDSNTQEKMSLKLRKLFLDNSNMRVKVILVSRPENTILGNLDRAGLSISIDAKTISDDLKAYINRGVDKLQSTKHLADQSCKTIRRQLHAKNGGTFLWVSFAIQAISSENTAKEMISVLATFPNQLYDVYDRILSEIEPKNQQAAIFVLRTILVAGDSLTDRDLAMLICVKDPECAELPTPLQVRESRGSYRHCRILLDLTHEIRGWDDGRVFIKFIHASVRDYLTSPYLRNHRLLSQFRCEIASCHLEIFEHCCKFRSLARDYISRQRMPLFSTFPADFEREDVLTLQYPPETSWLSQEDLSYMHEDRFRESENILSDRSQTIRCFAHGSFDWLWQRQNGLSAEALIICLLLDIPLIKYCTFHDAKTAKHTQDFFMNLAYLPPESAHPGITKEVLRVLERSSDPDILVLSSLHRSTHWARIICALKYIDINHTAEGTTALIAAIGCRDVDLVGIVLSHPKVDVNLYLAKTRFHGPSTPLIYACRNGSRIIVKLLLDRPELERTLTFSTDHPPRTGGRQLLPRQHPHISISDHTIVSLLLDEGIKPYETVIHDVCSQWLRLYEYQKQFPLKPLIERLVNSGASIDAMAVSGATSALHMWEMDGCTPGYTEMACILLSLGADLERRNSSGLTPAACAVLHERKEALEIFVVHGADVEAADDRGDTVLMHAIVSPDNLWTFVRTFWPGAIMLWNAWLLLDKGADPFVVGYQGYTTRSRLYQCFAKSLIKRDRLYHYRTHDRLKEAAGIFTTTMAILPPDRDNDDIANIVQLLDRMSPPASHPSNGWDRTTIFMAKKELEFLIDTRSWEDRFCEWQIWARQNGWKAEPDIVYQNGSVWLMAWPGAGTYKLPGFCISRYIGRALGGMEKKHVTSEWANVIKRHHITQFQNRRLGRERISVAKWENVIDFHRCIHGSNDQAGAKGMGGMDSSQDVDLD